ncbi:MAG: energy transducer TonB [Rubricoccaceae bacterium]|nr:energy transducer TonB [Rubricoccaceae bacterium]
MRRDDWTGLGVSLAVHLLLLLVIGVAVSAAKKPPPELRLVHLEFGPLDAPASAVRPSAYAPEETPQPPRPEPQPSPPRPTPPATTPVEPPRTPPTPPREPPLPRPETQPEAPPQPPAPPEPQPSPPTSGGTPTGQQGTNSNPESSSGAGNTGTSGLSIEGLGNRGATCSRPPYPGVSGTVTYAVTFAPDGRYVSSRPLRRGGDARIDRAVQSIIRTCRAQSLPDAASQVNQEGRITFRFTN